MNCCRALRWTAALYGKCPADLAVTGGVHTAIDGLKAVMAGASAVQLASALLMHGPRYLKTLRQRPGPLARRPRI